MPKSPAIVAPYRLKQLRLRNGLSAIQAAEKIGVSRATIQTWEAGTSRPVAHRLHWIARAYGVAIGDLLAAPPADSLAARRTSAGLLQRDLAHALGVSVARYGAVERRGTEPPDSWLDTLDKLLGDPPSES